jgi:hypothetical protein
MKTRKPRTSTEPPARSPASDPPGTMPVPVRQVLRSPRPQPKLTVSRPGDASEREADQVADHVMRLPGPGPGFVTDLRADDRAGGRPTGGEIRRKSTGPRRTSSEGPGPEGTVPEALAARLTALSNGGQPLPSAVRSFFEPRFGRDLGGVRLHTDPAAGELARSLDARAFSLGSAIVFGPGEYAPGSAAGRHLIAHELTHVLQQSGQPSAVRRQSSATGTGERVVAEEATGVRDRTVVLIHVVGNASPRWAAAGSPEEADALNADLAERRGRAVRVEVERRLRELLGDRDLEFQYDYSPADPLSGPADIVLGSDSRGSSETLIEAGERGRRANDPGMRRVEVRVELHQGTETTVRQDVERRERRSTATRDWGLWVVMQSGVSAGGSAGYIMVQLRNRRTGVPWTYHGHFSGVEAGVRVEITSTSIPSFEPFRTPSPMRFRDFHLARFVITGAKLTLGVGLSLERFRFTSFYNDRLPVPRDAIPTGGISFGGVGGGLSLVMGLLYLQGNPPDWREETVREQREQVYRSEGQEGSEMRILFETGDDRIRDSELVRLDRYLAEVARPYR